MPKTGIYQIRNLVNNKIYIGSTATNLQYRKVKHWSQLRRGIHPNRYLQNAWDMYSEDAFVFEVLITCHSSMCLWYEQQFLDEWQPEYNLSPTAENCLGVKHGAEHRRKTGLASRGRFCSDATRRKLSQSLRGRVFSEETKDKIGTANAGSYPALVDPDGTIYPPGINLTAFCRKHGLQTQNTWAVIQHRRPTCQGWRLLEN